MTGDGHFAGRSGGDPAGDLAPSGLARLIEQFVSDEPDVERIGPSTWMFPFELDGNRFTVIVSVLDDQLLAYATRLRPVPAERIDAMYELVGDLNSELRVAWFDCQREGGVISARAALDAEGVDVDETLIGNVVGAAVGAMGRFLPAIDAVADGEVEPAQLRALPDPNVEHVPYLDLDTATTEQIAELFDTLVDDD